MARKKFERSLVRQRNRIEMRGRKLAFNALKQQYKAVFDLVDNFMPNNLIEQVSNIVREDPIRDFMGKYYAMFAPIGLMTRNNALGRKDEEDIFYESVYTDKLRQFGLVETGSRVTGITATTEKYIRGAIESAVTEGFEQGYGVDKTSRLIRKYLQDSLGDIGRSRSKMIAQTEMITGSNYASEQAIRDTGLKYRKFWSTSGLKGVRGSHQQAESDSVNGIPEDQPFSNGLMYVGEIGAPPEEVINCRCTTLYEVL